jgi:hypothetical protein
MPEDRGFNILEFIMILLFAFFLVVFKIINKKIKK